MCDVKKIIAMDKRVNYHPKNRLFIFVFRWGHYFTMNNTIAFFKVIAFLFRIIAKITYNRYNHWPMEAQIGGGLEVPHNIGIVIAGNAIIGNNVTIMHQVTIGDNIIKKENAPIIGNNVFIGAGAKIVGECHVGNNVVIGTNSVITHDIPDNCVVVGVNRIIQQSSKDKK